MQKLIIPVATALAGALTACSFSPMQASATPAQGATLSAERLTSVKPFAVTIGAKGPVVGINLYATHNYTAAQTKADGERTLSYIKNTLHATGVDIVWIMYSPGYHSNSVVTSKANTLTAANVGILTSIAQHDGLYVEYRPMMFEQVKGNTWEGLLKPANPTVWFNHYYSANLSYLKMAQKYHINEYVIGTEMNSLSPDKQWSAFLAKSGKVFKGNISYAANQSMYFPAKRRQSPPTPLKGVDMYEPLKLPASASLGKVVAAYEQFFTAVPASLRRKTAIQETGIQARAGAYSDPPNLEATGKLDPAIQYNWFSAGCDAVKRFHLRGIFFWKVDLSDFPLTHPAPSLSTFEGREGATAIAKCQSIIKG